MRPRSSSLSSGLPARRRVGGPRSVAAAGQRARLVASRAVALRGVGVVRGSCDRLRYIVAAFQGRLELLRLGRSRLRRDRLGRLGSGSAGAAPLPSAGAPAAAARRRSRRDSRRAVAGTAAFGATGSISAANSPSSSFSAGSISPLRAAYSGSRSMIIVRSGVAMKIVE